MPPFRGYMLPARDTSQDTSLSNDNTTSLALSFPATCPANKLLVAAVWPGTDTGHVSTPSGWTKFLGVDHNSGTFCIVLYFKVSDGTETGVTLAISSSSTSMRGAFGQYSGIATSSPSDQSAAAQSGGSGSTSTATGTTGSTAQANELIITCVHINGDGTSFSWTNGTKIYELGSHGTSMAQRIVTSVGTYNDTATWTGSLFSCALIGTFKASISGQGVNVTGQAISRAALY